MSFLYPMHEKLKTVKDRTQAIHEFLEWLSSEKGVHLCDYVGSTCMDDELYMIHREKRDRLLAEFFEIDIWELEKEKMRMLQVQRELNAKRGL